MNERIKLLAAQARKKPLGDSWCYATNPNEFEQKFAELIVWECLTICEELGDKGMDGHYCADKISKTFRS